MTIENTEQPKGLWRAFSSLRHHNYRLYWSGQVISLLGSAMQVIGQSWLVLELTHSAWQLGMVGALQAVPILLFSLFGGFVADRWPKRHVMFVTQAVDMLQALLLWALTISGAVQVWHLYLLALLLGCMNCLYRPASSAFVVELVGREDLPNAVALSSSLATLARIVGPGIAGVILARSDVSVLFLINALSFLAVLASLALINNTKLHAQARHVAGKHLPIWQSLREGFAYIRETPVVLLLLLVVGLVLLFGSNFNVVLPLFATDILHMGATGFGILSAASSIGALLATLWLAWNSQKPTMRSMLLGTLIFGVLELAFALSRLYLLSILLIASVGFAESTFAAQAITTLQTVVPDHLRGRVMSVQVLVFDGSLPLGYLLMGWLSALYGPTNALLTGALLSLLAVGGGWLYRLVPTGLGSRLT